jgi:hypothetical protein
MQLPKLTTTPLEAMSMLQLRRVNNRRRGLDTAWSNANEFISLKKGYPLMIAGVGGSGKTEVAFDIMLNSSLMYGWRWLVLSPETGDQYEIIEALVEKMANGAVLEKTSQYAMSDKKFDQIMKWLNDHFRILDPTEHWKGNFTDLQLNIENFFSAVHKEEERLGGKFDGVMIDPFNELDIEISGSIANTVKNELDRLIAWTKKKNYLTILTNHANDKTEVREKNAEGEWYFWTPPNKKEEWAYGAQFGRKGYQMLLLHEPHPEKQSELANAIPSDLEMEHSIQCHHNVRDVYVQKTKPKGVGKTGKFRLFYDRSKQRYYSLDENGNKKGLLYLD